MQGRFYDFGAISQHFVGPFLSFLSWTLNSFSISFYKLIFLFQFSPNFRKVKFLILGEVFNIIISQIESMYVIKEIALINFYIKNKKLQLLIKYFFQKLLIKSELFHFKICYKLNSLSHVIFLKSLSILFYISTYGRCIYK